MENEEIISAIHKYEKNENNLGNFKTEIKKSLRFLKKDAAGN